MESTQPIILHNFNHNYESPADELEPLSKGCVEDRESVHGLGRQSEGEQRLRRLSAYFISHLATSAQENKDALICKPNSFAQLVDVKS
jgi:hypothetical protein